MASNAGNSEKPILEEKLGGLGFIPLEKYWLNWIIFPQKELKVKIKHKVGNQEFRTCTHHVPILLFW